MSSAFELLHGEPVEYRAIREQRGDPIVAAANVEKLALWLGMHIHDVKNAYILGALPALVLKRWVRDQPDVFFIHQREGTEDPPLSPVQARRIHAAMAKHVRMRGCHVTMKRELWVDVLRLLQWVGEGDAARRV